MQTPPKASALVKAEEGKTDTSLSLAYSHRADTTQSNLIIRSGHRWDYGGSFVTSSTADPYVTFGAGGARYWDFDQEEQRTILSLRGSADFVFNPSGDLGFSGRYLDAEVRVRGFALGGIAPRGDNGTAIGGTKALGASLTLNHQLIESESFPVFANLYFDVGSVFDQGETFTLDVNGTATTYRDSARLRSSAGVGFALATPGGTLSVSYSQPLSFADFDVLEEFQFNIGTQF